MEEEEGIGEINGNATNTIKFFLNEKNKTINLLLGFSLGKRTFIFKSLITIFPLWYHFSKILIFSLFRKGIFYINFFSMKAEFTPDLSQKAKK